MCETPGRNCWIQSFNNSFGRLMISGVQSSLLTAEKKTKKKKKTRSLPVNSSLIPLCGWFLISCTFAQLQTPSLYVTLMLIPEWWWIAWIIVPLLPLLGSRSARTWWSHSPGVQSLREKSMSSNLAAVPLPVAGWDTVRPLWAAWYVLEGTACCCN